MKISSFWKLAVPVLGLMIVAGMVHHANPTVQSTITLWTLAWLLGFAFVLAAEVFDLSTRAFIFVIYSCALGVGGKALFDEKFWVADAIMQFMLILGGGLGAGLMADYIIKHDKPAN